MSIYWLCLIPFLLWFAAILFQVDRLNSRGLTLAFLTANVLCLAAGIALYRYQVFAEKRGFFVVAFGLPLIWIAIFEIFRMIYRAIRHENPSINVRSGKWIGDRPTDGFFTTYPPEKVISWADVIFGISQAFVPAVITMVLIIWSLAANW